jgi:hypothetical protein
MPQSQLERVSNLGLQRSYYFRVIRWAKFPPIAVSESPNQAYCYVSPCTRHETWVEFDYLRTFVQLARCTAMSCKGCFGEVDSQLESLTQ